MCNWNYKIVIFINLNKLYDLNSFLTGKKVHCIPPIFHESRFITNFREKFSYLTFQCSLITNSVIVPTDFELVADHPLSNTTFKEKDFGKIIRSFGNNRTHGHNMISICMLKICWDFIYKTLRLLSSGFA